MHKSRIAFTQEVPHWGDCVTVQETSDEVTRRERIAALNAHRFIPVTRQGKEIQVRTELIATIEAI